MTTTELDTYTDYIAKTNATMFPVAELVPGHFYKYACQDKLANL